MTTYRERREARAERLRTASASNTAKAADRYGAARQTADMIPFGQPILVGHHSEKADRNRRGRMVANFEKSFELSAKAAEQSSRADEIDRQADNAIYDDDPDALERLAEKLTRLEGERERRKAANAVYRKEHRDELKAMTAYERSCSVPYPSYSISNLGGQITNVRKRIEHLTAAKAVVAAGGRGRGRPMLSRYPGTCEDCGQPIERGDEILWFKLTRETTHAACPVKPDA